MDAPPGVQIHSGYINRVKEVEKELVDGDAVSSSLSQARPPRIKVFGKDPKDNPLKSVFHSQKAIGLLQLMLVGNCPPGVCREGHFLRIKFQRYRQRIRA